MNAWSKRACVQLQHRWRSKASGIVDAEESHLQHSSTADKFKTDLTDSLRIAEDAGQQWREEWEKEEQEEHASLNQMHRRLEDWEEGRLKAGSRESARERDERMFTQGTMPSNQTPPHPPEFEGIVRRVRYAHLMPVPEPPPSTEKSLYLSESFPLLTSLVDRLRELPGVSVDSLKALPIKEHDKLLAAHYNVVVREGDVLIDGVSEGEELLLPTTSAESETEVPPAGGTEGEVGGEVSEASVSETAAPPVDKAGTGPAEVFRGQNKLMDEGVGEASLPPAPPSQSTRVRQRERALTASQTLVAVATQCEEPVAEIIPSVIAAVGRTGDLEYVQYYWNLSQELLDPADKSTAHWAAYVRALSECGSAAVQIAYNTIEDMKNQGITPCINTWNALMLCYCNNYDQESALKVAENIRMFANLNPNHETFLCTMLAHLNDMSQERESNARRALNVMYEMTQVYRMEPTRAHYETLLRALRYVAIDSEWYLEMQTYAQQMKYLGMPWSPMVYSQLMWVEGVRGDVDKVRELFITMRQRKLPPTDRVYAAIILGYSRSIPPTSGRRPQDVNRWAAKQQQMWEADHDSPPPLDEWRERMFQEGMTIFNLAKEHPSAIPHTRYHLLGLAALLKPSELRRIWAEECQPHVEVMPRLYGSYVSMLLRLDQNGDVDALDDAEAAFAEGTLAGVRLAKSIYVDMMAAHIRTGRDGSVDVALDYMKALERSGQTISSGGAYFIKKLIDDMGPKRDAIRRAKSLMERRKNLSNTLFAGDDEVTLAHPGEAPAPMTGLTPDGFAFPSSDSGVNPDGTLVGDSFEDRSVALAQMGYQPMHIENTQTLREGTKVNDWMAYTASTPGTLAVDHASFDKVLANNTQVGAGDSAVNEWHRERMAAAPYAYKADGTLDQGGEQSNRTDEDSPARMLLKMQKRAETDDYDLNKPYFSKSFAHTAHDPAAWTADQERFMSEWRKTSGGKAHTHAMQRSRKLRGNVLKERTSRGEKKFPDEL